MTTSMELESNSVSAAELEQYRLCDDVLYGASEISEFLYGDKKKRRKIYYLFRTSKHFPAFKIGCKICVRKSVLLTWIQEGKKKIAPLKTIPSYELFVTSAKVREYSTTQLTLCTAKTKMEVPRRRVREENALGIVELPINLMLVCQSG